MNPSGDEQWMTRALKLAEKGRNRVSPNPMVGACVVRNGRLVGEGYHAFYGGPHAEVHALKKAGKQAKGATLYVTLEPCASWGKTPPCVSAIITAGIKKVVMAATDQNPENRLKGVAALKKAGIQVRTGVLTAQAKRQNESFFKWTQTKRPFVTLKMAQSLDGKIATSTGRSRWITSPPAREFVHRLRLEQDGILIGKNTLLADNPLLSPRISASNTPAKPWRIVLDPRLEVSPRARIFQGPQLTVMVVSEKAVRKMASRKFPHLILIAVKEKNGRLNLKELLQKLGGLGIAKLLVEGGGETAWSLLEAGLVDRALWIMAPKIIGGRNAKTSVEGQGVSDPNRAFSFRETAVTKLGPDFIFEGRLK